MCGAARGAGRAGQAPKPAGVVAVCRTRDRPAAFFYLHEAVVEVEAGEAGVDADVGLVRLLQHPPHHPVHVGARLVVVLAAQLRRAGPDAEPERDGGEHEDGELETTGHAAATGRH
jgi:hypothetical protein